MLSCLNVLLGHLESSNSQFLEKRIEGERGQSGGQRQLPEHHQPFATDLVPDATAMLTVGTVPAAEFSLAHLLQCSIRSAFLRERPQERRTTKDDGEGQKLFTGPFQLLSAVEPSGTMQCREPGFKACCSH